MRRALEFEIRLSYHDRIVKTLPPVMQEEGSHVIAVQAPGPDFEYEEPSKSGRLRMMIHLLNFRHEHIASLHHDAAQSVLNLLRGRAKANEVIAHLDSLKNTIESSDGAINVDAVVRSIAVQSLLNIGSRSFSHLLNAIERYLPLLRSLASGGIAGAGAGGGAEAKGDILTAAAAFWKRNKQMVNIVFDKLMQYQIVDPTDVVAWTFTNVAGDGHPSGMGPLSLSAFEWDLLKGALDKANGRVMIARRKVAVLRKEEDDNRAKAKARGGVDVSSMEVDGDANVDIKPGKAL
jgi:nuclear cap-binding protein subunit 1